MAEVFYGQGIIESIGRRNARVTFDYATAIYLAQKEFFVEMSRLTDEVANSEDGIVKLEASGKTVDINSTGGLIAINLYMQEIETQYKTFSGLGQKGLQVELNVWKNI